MLHMQWMKKKKVKKFKIDMLEIDLNHIVEDMQKEGFDLIL